MVVATFSEKLAGRPVSLQTKTDEGWQEVGQAELTKQGRAEFHPTSDSGKVPYRAVALDYESEGQQYPAEATPNGSSSAQWKKVFSDGFAGSSLTLPFSVRSANEYWAPRYCAASMASMVSLSDGTLSLGADKVGAARAKPVRARAAQLNGTSVADACPNGVYDNAMVGTQERYLFTYGTVAARVKFPYQRGMHAAVWLQTADGTDVEIDIIESFGHGSKSGIQNMLHPKGPSGERLDIGTLVESVPEVAERAWWDEYHIVSVDWSAEGYVFRIDGVETFRTSKKKGLSAVPHFLVLSLQTSDYETNRLDQSELPATFDVDWIKVWQER